MSKFISLVTISILLVQNSLGNVMPFRAEDSSKRKATQTKKQKERKAKPWYQRIPIVRSLTAPKKTIRTMSYDELEVSKNLALQEGLKETAVKYLEKMIPLCQDLNKKSDNLLEVADLFFDLGNLAKSELYYSQFVLLYPGDKRIWQALNRSILCSYYQIGTIDRDQSKTEQTLELINKFLTRVDQSDPGRISEEVQQCAKEVLKLKKDCQLKLCENELYIIDFYIKSGRNSSAQKRIKDFRANWLEKVPEIEYALLQREITFAQKQNNIQLVEKAEKEMQDKFPEIASKQLVYKGASTSSDVEKKHASNRF